MASFQLKTATSASSAAMRKRTQKRGRDSTGGGGSTPVLKKTRPQTTEGVGVTEGAAAGGGPVGEAEGDI